MMQQLKVHPDAVERLDDRHQLLDDLRRASVAGDAIPAKDGRQDKLELQHGVLLAWEKKLKF